MPVPQGTRFRVKKTPKGKKIRLAFKNDKVIEAKRVGGGVGDVLKLAFTRKPGALGKLDPGSLFGASQTLGPRKAFGEAAVALTSPSDLKIRELQRSGRLLQQRLPFLTDIARRQVGKAQKNILEQIIKLAKR